MMSVSKQQGGQVLAIISLKLFITIDFDLNNQCDG
jgi:hypothetical protein